MVLVLNLRLIVNFTIRLILDLVLRTIDLFRFSLEMRC